MLISRDIKVLHLEPTDVCQAACPACAREIDGHFQKDRRHHLTFQQIEEHISTNQIAYLDKMFMCGNYGDPAAGQHTLEIYQRFRHINPNLVLGMNTNGAIQNCTWWTQLGEIFQGELDYVVFSIDGLQDTNHIYRRGVDWHKMIKNIQAYLNTGASAHWDMLVYRHNEHQVDACEQLARDMGFTWFRAKISKRPLLGPLAYPMDWPQPLHQSRNISCQALREKSMYIDAQGRMSPCCFLGSRQTNFIEDFESIVLSWTSTRPDATCVAACGTDDGNTNFSNQWQRQIQLC